MAAAVGIVVGQRQIEPAVAIEVHELHAVRRIVFEHHVGQRFDERCAPLMNNASRYSGWPAMKLPT